jgi:predicted amidohydrolase YtcJ
MIRAGYQADVVVLDRDLLGAHPDFIPHTAVLTTIVGGDVVWNAGSSSAISDVGAGKVPGTR